MSQKEANRAQVLGLLEERHIGQKEAAKRLGVTARQVRRLTQRYRAEGLPGLSSKKRGKASNRRPDETLAGRHDIHLSVESTRQLMIQAGYWRPKKGSAGCAHPMRARRARFGGLIQIDGSPHDWFEGRGEYCTLLVFIDDATGRWTQLRWVTENDIFDNQ